MSTELTVLEAEAVKLSPEARALLADHVFASLRQQDEVDEARDVEVHRRFAEVQAGDLSSSRSNRLSSVFAKGFRDRK